MERIHGDKAKAYFALRDILVEMNATVTLIVDITEGKDEGDTDKQMMFMRLAMRDLRGAFDKFEQAFKS